MKLLQGRSKAGSSCSRMTFLALPFEEEHFGVTLNFWMPRMNVRMKFSHEVVLNKEAGCGVESWSYHLLAGVLGRVTESSGILVSLCGR